MSLPIVTVTRFLFVVFYIYAFINKRKSINLKSFNIKNVPMEYRFLAAYFILRIISNLYYVTTYGQAIKTIFVIVFEQLLFMIAFCMLDPSKEETEKLIRIIVGVATVLFVTGIFESITSIRPFDALFTVSRELINMHFERLGLLRATTTMIAPAIYGNMCLYMLPFILYLYETTRLKRYIAILGLAVLAIIHSGSRSDMFFLVATLLVYVVFVLKDKERRLHFCKNATVVTGVLFLYICIASIFFTNLRYFYVGNAKAILNEVGFDFDLDEGAPEGVEGYGNNHNGSASRTRQLTGLYYTATINPIFGLGSGAQRRGDVKYAWRSKKTGNITWNVVNSYDLVIVEMFCDEGLLGLLAICSLLYYMFRQSKGNRFYRLAFFCYMLSSLSTGNLYAFLFMYLTVFAAHNKYFKSIEYKT